MGAFLTWTIGPFFLGLIIMFAGHVVYEQTKGWDNDGLIVSLMKVAWIWGLGIVAFAVGGGFGPLGLSAD